MGGIFTRSMLSVAVSCALTATAYAQDDDTVELDTFVTEDVVDEMNLLPTEPVDSVFGFDKTLLKTPRSVSTISTETIDAYGISDIDDLVILAPGAFTQSFFGVAGSLDVRGTPGETYFRGVRRLDNPGNYPTPIGASDRIDIVRGPASPVYGPSKIGGYLNFVPKSARAETGQYLEEPTGKFSVTRGTWDKNIMSAEVGGPASMFGKDMGYYVYAETENSGSYYQNTKTDQNLFQASFNMDFSDSVRFEFGGMYHEYDGNQVAGWNRLTQDLIDTGTYITGTAQPLDTDGDGLISHGEYGAGGTTNAGFSFSGPPSAVTDADIPANYNLVNPGTTILNGSQVLVAADDVLQNDVLTLYFDTIIDNGGAFTFTNKFFYEEYENLNENAYGFSQFHDSWVIENQFIIATEMETDGLTTNLQISPSIRYTDFKHGDDFFNEYFDRRDLTGPSTALDARVLATRSNFGWSEYYEGDYIDYGFAILADLDFDFGLGVVLGVRHDTVDVESSTPTSGGGRVIFQGASSSEDTTEGLSWNVSISYELPFGLVPYVTLSEQATVIAGQGADINEPNLLGSNYFDTSELTEFGIKGNLLDDQLFFGVAVFDMERTDFSAQSAVTNQSVQTEGVELEVRYVVSENLSLSAVYTEIEATNLNTEQGGGRFSFYGAEDLVNVSDPSLVYGGLFFGFVPNAPVDGAVKSGVPETSYSLSATYDFLNGLSGTVSLFHADETFSGHSKAVVLPDYDLVNATLSYDTELWSFRVVGKNLTDERYFRANFANLFGSQIVLPELPRHMSVSASYKF